MAADVRAGQQSALADQDNENAILQVFFEECGVAIRCEDEQSDQDSILERDFEYLLIGEGDLTTVVTDRGYGDIVQTEVIALYLADT